MAQLITIRLKYRDGETKDVEVALDKVHEASTLIVREAYFQFSSMKGQFFSIPMFEQVNPPVDITEEATRS